MEYYKYNPIKNNFVKTEKPLLCQNSFLPQLVWHITDKCLLNCVYCFATKTDLDFPISKIDEFVDLFLKLGIQKIDISGGEPLLYPHLEILCQKLLKKNIYLTITTSSIGFEKNTNFIIHKKNNFTRIIISLDGPKKEHDYLRDKKGTFNSVNNLIERLKENHCKRIRINTVVTKIFLDKNICRETAKIINVLSPHEWCLIQPHPANKLNTFIKYKIDVNDFLEIIKNMNYFLKFEKGPSINVLYRFQENYSGYWILYPNGFISKHTNTNKDIHNIQFCMDNYKKIKNVILAEKYWIPT